MTGWAATGWWLKIYKIYTLPLVVPLANLDLSFMSKLQWHGPYLPTLQPGRLSNPALKTHEHRFQNPPLLPCLPLQQSTLCGVLYFCALSPSVSPLHRWQTSAKAWGLDRWALGRPRERGVPYEVTVCKLVRSEVEGGWVGSRAWLPSFKPEGKQGPVSSGEQRT